MTPENRDIALAAGASLVLLAVSLATRSLIPIDETRYASVAWEMWQRSDWLVPYLNGAPYSHKPPLLFWLVGLGWGLFGVTESWVRIVPGLFSTAGIVLTGLLQRRLWQDAREDSVPACWLLLGTVLWALFGTVTFFDPLLAFFTLCGAHGLLYALEERSRVLGFALFGASLGLAILSKGPVAFLHLLPIAIAAPWWAGERFHGRRGHYFGDLVLAIASACLLALAWAIPAAWSGGEEYGKRILWGQTAGRVIGSFAHRRGFFFYVMVLPAVLVPWTLWPTAWRAASRIARRMDLGTRFCLAWAGASLALLSLVSGKQPQYLLPCLPAFALLLAHGLGGPSALRFSFSRLLPASLLAALGASLFLGSLGIAQNLLPTATREIPAWTGLALLGIAMPVGLVFARNRAQEVRLLAMGMLASLIVLHLGAIGPILASRDPHPVAVRIRAFQEQGRPIAHIGAYDGQYQFLGRLARPIETIDARNAVAWAESNPEGILIRYGPAPPRDGPRPELSRPYRGRRVTLWLSPEFLRFVADTGE